MLVNLYINDGCNICDLKNDWHHLRIEIRQWLALIMPRYALLPHTCHHSFPVTYAFIDLRGFLWCFVHDVPPNSKNKDELFWGNSSLLKIL
jgi:hypothetical protein